MLLFTTKKEKKKENCKKTLKSSLSVINTAVLHKLIIYLGFIKIYKNVGTNF